MPLVSKFFGITIAMYFNDHSPPHFHVRYVENTAKIAIDTLEIIKGKLPSRVLSLVLEWSVLHRSELSNNWKLAQNGKPTKQIKPLE